MNYNKGKLAKAFDEGRLEELLREDLGILDDSGEAEYSRDLFRIEEALQSAPGYEVPKGFTASVLQHLPELNLREIRIVNLRDFLIPAILAVSVFLSFIFSEPLGLTELMALSASFLRPVEKVDMQIIFLVFSCTGILGVAWLIITSFFGVRSRRVTHYRYK